MYRKQSFSEQNSILQSGCACSHLYPEPLHLVRGSAAVIYTLRDGKIATGLFVEDTAAQVEAFSAG